jgi:hypothetical protein
MKLLNKLNQIADRWVNTIDGQLQHPVVQTISGEVFAHGIQSRQQAAAEPLEFDIDVDASAACEAVARAVQPDIAPLPAPSTGTSLVVT